MINSKNRLAYAVAAVLTGTGFAVATPGVALAQEATGDSIEEILVTAQRRTQSLQDVPIAMQVVDSALIQDVAAENMGDLNGFVPGLVISDGSPTQPRYQIRGIQTGDFGVGTDPAVGVYVDGIYAARSGASLLAFNDIERIEVLKGPQGTLFGRNSAAGAISIVTRQPEDEFHSLLRVRVGEYGKQYYEGMLNTPLGENVAVRINGVYNKSDGWLEDAATGQDLMPEENWAGRVALRWKLSDQTSATLSWDHDDLDQLARPAIGLIPLQAGQTQVPFPADPATYLDPRKAPVYNDVVGNEESRQLDQVNLFIDHSFAAADFRSSTSWRQFDTVNREDEDGTNLIGVYFDTANIEDNESFYQEFKLAGKTDSIDWVGGVSYYKEKANQISDTHTFTDGIDTLATNLGIYDELSIPFPLFAGTSNFLEPFGVTMLGMPWREAMYNRGDFEAFAAFGDVIWHLNDKTNLTFGLRYTHDSKEFTWINGPHETPELDAVVAGLEDVLVPVAPGVELPFFTVFPIPPEAYRFADVIFAVDTPPGGLTKKDSWDDVSPRLVLDYKVVPNVMVFGSLAKGYKAGGYNSTEVGSEFENEDVWNVETGFKSVFPEAGVILNASAFYYIYENKQSIALVSNVEGSDIPQYLIDTSDEKAWGIDVDAQWRPVDQLRLYANVAYIDATYKDKLTRGEDPLDLSGEPTGEPYLSAALGASYGWALGATGDVELSGRFAYRGKSRCNADSERQGNCALQSIFKVGEATERLDLRLAWTSASDTFGLAAYVTNVLDDQYVTGINNLTTNTFGTPFASISEPRQWGVEATVSF
ncbi:TonB-dependent receptor [Steroidobacter agaridevorans]|uniref:TonB-dependent receptor n=1 Tax=Steroidobacter agaridevorans TaxID=2695856 RepID=A0A829YCL0_9GAMM|nr:TonB-dependent receptor [Steroidobacter agaridevorans]GFE80581.1 TonB-dependent receptor [Steroidobacter agaridevorans]GFE87636.1 TonB-dependent receptor [Steroidobacter agaridevorans]